MKIKYTDEAHRKHRECVRRYRRRKKYGGVVPKFTLREDVFLKLVGGRSRAGRGNRGGYTGQIALIGLGHQSLFQLKRYCSSKMVRRRMCEYFGVTNGYLFKRIN